MSWLDDLFYGYRTIRNALGADSPTRAILKVVGATITDDPATGATIITIAGGTPLATLTGAGFVHVNSTDPQNPVVSLSPAPASAATPETLVVRDASGDAYFADVYASNGFIATASGALDVHQATAIAGDGADGTIAAQDGTQSGNHDGGNLNLSGGLGHGTGAPGGVALQVGGDTVWAVGIEPLLGGAKVASLGTDLAGPCGIVIEPGVTLFEMVRKPRASVGNAYQTNFSGQDATDGDGGGIQFSTGAKGGGGTRDGVMDFGVGGVALLHLEQGVARLGDNSNSSTSSVELSGPERASATGGSASALPALPQGYLELKINGSTRRFAFYNP